MMSRGIYRGFSLQLLPGGQPGAYAYTGKMDGNQMLLGSGYAGLSEIMVLGK
jgi:hypothetical protein